MSVVAALQDHVRLVRPDEAQGVVNRAGLRDDLAVRVALEQATEPAAHDGVIVSEYHANLRFGHGFKP